MVLGGLIGSVIENRVRYLLQNLRQRLCDPAPGSDTWQKNARGLLRVLLVPLLLRRNLRAANGWDWG